MAIRYTHKEELWNSWSHAGGIVMGVIFGVIFLWMSFRGDNPWARLGVCLYLFGMLTSYIASTVYHALPLRSKWRERFRHWDHAAIYWHIAGSYSPLTLIALLTQGYWGWSLFSFVWLCAIAGTNRLSTVCRRLPSSGLSQRGSAILLVHCSTPYTRNPLCTPSSTSSSLQAASATSLPSGTC